MGKMDRVWVILFTLEGGKFVERKVELRIDSEVVDFLIWGTAF